MEESLAGKNASDQENEWIWGVWMKFEKILSCLLYMCCNYVSFRFGEDECCKTREENRKAEDLVSSKCRERVGPVATRHSSKEKASKSSSVLNHSLMKMWEVS